LSKQTNDPRPEDNASPYYHHPKKGCDLVWFGYYGKNKKYIKNKVDKILGINWAHLSRGKCRTHTVKVCFCGYQIGTHDSVISKGYKLNR
jgi:hypothetical protein